MVGECLEVRLEPMSDEEYAHFRERSEVSYAAEIAASRAVPLSEARRKAAEDHEPLDPSERPPVLAAYRVMPLLWAGPGALGVWRGSIARDRFPS